MNDILEKVPDSIKISTAISSSVFTFMGMPVEQWMYILSAIVSLLFILEKLPKAVNSVRLLYQWIIGKRDAPVE